MSRNVVLSDESSIIAPDFFLPAQWWEMHRSSAQSTPAQRLVLALLEEAIGCILTYRHVATVSGRRLYREAREWVFSRDQAQTFSFENVCGHLSINAAFLRQKLMPFCPVLPEIIRQHGPPPRRKGRPQAPVVLDRVTVVRVDSFYLWIQTADGETHRLPKVRTRIEGTTVMNRVGSTGAIAVCRQWARVHIQAMQEAA